ncbi:MAG TPA: PstS family phosphate ABC transporter substrate-binding protein [Egibacteraceae bacterium]|nr:PstS family phosphate ABC transporter substrate-binding protein [Egibacteraceae bacterium]
MRLNKLLLGLLMALALVATACGNAPDDTGTTDNEEAPEDGGGPAGDEVSGTIEIDGSSTVAPLTDAIAEEYNAAQPGVEVNVGVSGTGGGFERFCETGDTQISNASRPIKESEAQACADNGIEFTEVRVGTDALTMVTSADTDWVDCLTTEEVVKLWGPDGVDSWDQVREGFPAEPVQVFAPGADSGTYDFMNETVLEEDVQPRQDYNASEDDNVIAQGIQGTKGSWGFFGFAYYQENADTMKAISFDAGDGCVEPSAETAQDDSYKLARPLFIYVRNDALQEAHVADFVTFYLDTVNDVIEEVGYIPATDEELAEARASVEGAIG